MKNPASLFAALLAFGCTPALKPTPPPPPPNEDELPVVRIAVEGGREITAKTDEYLAAEFELEHEAHGFKSPVGIRGRGNTTWLKPKKPWRIKFNEKRSLFGLPAAKSWVLLALWQDPTLIMNEVAFEVGRRFGVTPVNSSRFVELWMNGTYRGVYQLTEQIEAGDGRVEIDEAAGGFLLELDKYWDDEPRFRTALYNLPVMVKDPETAEAAATAREALDALEASFAAGDWAAHVDERAFINYMLASEMVRNPDIGQPKSLYIHRVDARSKLIFGPMWDYDWGFGYAADESFDYFRPKALTALYGPHRRENGRNGIGFLTRFFDDKALCARYKARWRELRASGATDFGPFIDKLAETLRAAAYRNSGRWPNGKDFDSEVDALKRWLSERATALDREIERF